MATTDDLSLLSSEKAVQEVIKQPLVKGIDGHLVELSETLTTVAKALKQVADEGKASVQAEAEEWKRKYELERKLNLQMQKELASLAQHSGTSKKETVDNVKDLRPVLPIGASNKHNELERKLNLQIVQDVLASGEDGGVSYKGRGDDGKDLQKNFSYMTLRDGESACPYDFNKNKRLKKVSFKLLWRTKGENSNQHKQDIVSFERGNITTASPTSKQISLKWESPPQTVLIFTRPNSDPVKILCAKMVRWLKEEKKLNIFVEPRVKAELLAEPWDYSFVQTWQDDKEITHLHNKVDLIVTLGGDGTVLWTASMFKEAVPPMVPFALGSLGFMTPFESGKYKGYLKSILDGPVSLTLRQRLQCHVTRKSAESESEKEGPILVLNEVTIDRGSSSSLTNLECFCENAPVTRVQADGLILSTTSGSTAYSLAAGGSMVHPHVPGILLTPICPHSLSFRPLILPEHVTLKVQVSLDSRDAAWVSFDGKDRKKLAPGDALVCSMARWPVPTACTGDSTSDFFYSINQGLNWNLRKTQSTFDAPPKDT